MPSLRRAASVHRRHHAGAAPDLPPLALVVSSPFSTTAEPVRIRRETPDDSPHARFQGLPVWCPSLLRSPDNSSCEVLVLVLVLGRSAGMPDAYEQLGLIDGSAPRVVQSLL
ncbi:hypothetical protein F4818DRAFT_437875 [Hypoxylon cercidicola]|nr:hypothetical protein F4818DRAFT_437875 [Hypoxylon cercidicola]